MTKDISQAVREVCLSFPETEEFVSHGSPNFRVRKGKIFATYVVNHHGDGRIALWLNAPDGAQAHYVAPSDPGTSGSSMRRSWRLCSIAAASRRGRSTAWSCPDSD